jgi:hypothetical protein
MAKALVDVHPMRIQLRIERQIPTAAKPTINRMMLSAVNIAINVLISAEIRYS